MCKTEIITRVELVTVSGVNIVFRSKQNGAIIAGTNSNISWQPNRFRVSATLK